METEKIEKPMRGLTWSFAAAGTSFLLMVISPALFDHKSSSLFAIRAAWCIVGGLTIGGIAFYVFLGILAKRLNHSPIIWVGLTFLSSPFGPIIAYLCMRHLVNEVTNEIARKPKWSASKSDNTTKKPLTAQAALAIARARVRGNSRARPIPGAFIKNMTNLGRAGFAKVMQSFQQYLAKLRGWERLWVMVSVLLLVPIGYATVHAFPTDADIANETISRISQRLERERDRLADEIILKEKEPVDLFAEKMDPPTMQDLWRRFLQLDKAVGIVHDAKKRTNIPTINYSLLSRQLQVSSNMV